MFIFESVLVYPLHPSSTDPFAFAWLKICRIESNDNNITRMGFIVEFGAILERTETFSGSIENAYNFIKKETPTETVVFL